MNIAILGVKTRPASAGADRVVEKLLERFEGDDNRYVVYLMARKATHRIAAHGNIRYVYLPSLPGKHLAAFSFFLLSALHLTWRGGVDLAHVHNSDFGLFCPILRLRRRLRIAGTFHGDPYRREKWGAFARLVLRASERVFVESCDVLTSVSRFKARVKGLVRTREATYIPNGVDPYWNAPIERHFDFTEAGVSPGRYLLFACGRLDATKGLHWLLEAFRRTSISDPLLVIGDATHDPAYSARVREAAARDPRVVVRPELLDRDRLIDVLRQARLFVFPSEVEAMSMMLLEAISCKRLVVASDIPENRTVTGDDFPYLFRTQDPEDLARSLTRAWEAVSATDRGTHTLVESLHARCLEEFSWTAIARTYQDTYGQLVPRTNDPAPHAAAA
jgi:glycosyltransferase involved in cell wall biosynthesis